MGMKRGYMNQAYEQGVSSSCLETKVGLHQLPGPFYPVSPGAQASYHALQSDQRERFMTQRKPRSSLFQTSQVLVPCFSGALRLEHKELVRYYAAATREESTVSKS